MDADRGYMILNEGTPEESQVPLIHFVITPHTSEVEV
jgi:hypothetical protein